MSYTNDSGNSARLGKTKIINAEHSDGAAGRRSSAEMCCMDYLIGQTSEKLSWISSEREAGRWWWR